MANTNPEQDWFRVYVGEDAEFIAPAESGFFAEVNVRGYCSVTRYLMLDPEMMLKHGVWAKPLEPIDADYYRNIANMTGVASIRLIADKRKLRQPGGEIRATETSEIDGQLALFGMKKALNSRTDFEYSYYNE
jgi:hypothetical protein